jgi:hypothetical protein
MLLSMTDPNNDTTPSLAARAVACKHWRWMPGMTYFGAGIQSDKRMQVGLRMPVPEDGDLYWRTQAAYSGCLPDLDDPATLGCLLALVREAWADDLLCTSEGHDLLSEHWWSVSSTIRRNSDLRACGLSRVSEAEALVAALEAAP